MLVLRKSKSVLSSWRAAISLCSCSNAFQNFDSAAAAAEAARPLSAATSKDRTRWHHASLQLPRIGYNIKMNDFTRLSQLRLRSSFSEHETESDPKQALNKVGHNYKQIGGPIDASKCDLSETEIHNLIRDRVKCRRARDFERSDSIRDELFTCGVYINDHSKSWRGDGKFFVNEFGHHYGRVGGSIDESVCDLSEAEVHNLIRERINYKHSGDYKRADSIRRKLERCGVFIDDIFDLWRGDGNPTFPRGIVRRAKREVREIIEEINRELADITGTDKK